MQQLPRDKTWINITRGIEESNRIPVGLMGMGSCPFFFSSSTKSRVTVSPWVSRCNNLRVILAIHRSPMGRKYYRANGCISKDFQNFERLSEIFSI
ncbi:hypothetical protein V1477_000793 [Vespula maculifrons]|uniref:Uncharacterized protein n=1 Tax=Vespula maculifrons TaxID=7453 RepID=A0ABD2CZZ6_VESMC